MARETKYDDDSDPFDETGMLKDQRSFSVPMKAMDSQQKAVRDHFALHKPGSRFLSDSRVARDQQRLIDQAYAERDYELQNAWRGEDDNGEFAFSRGQRGDPCTCRGPEYPDDFGSPGHLEMVNGQLCCVPDRIGPNDSQRLIRTHTDRMRVIHDELDRELSEQWKGGK